MNQAQQQNAARRVIRQAPKLPRVIDITNEPEPASPQYAGHHTGLPARQPYQYRRTKEEPSQNLTPRSYTYRPGDALDEMIARGDAIEMEDGVMFRDKDDPNTYYYPHNGPAPVPKRASRGASWTTIAQYAIPQHAASLPHETGPQPHRQQPQVKGPRRRLQWRRIHPLFWIGFALLVMILGWMGLNDLGTWWQNWRNTSTYGYPRTFQIDAVVGHGGDSAANPSHFTVENLRGDIVIIELPAGNISKAIIYGAGQVTGDQPDLTPVILSFQDEPSSKGPAMIVHIADSQMVWLNNGSKFLPPSARSTGG